MKCPQCGAAIESPGTGATVRCRYCRTTVEGPKPTAAPFTGFDDLFADQNGNGVPDAFEGLLKGSSSVRVGQVSYTVNGVQYDHLEDVPPDLRNLLAKAQGLLGDPAPPAGVSQVVVQGRAAPGRSKGWLLLAVAVAFLAGGVLVLLLL